MRPVRVLVHLNNLTLGGAQLNAVDIARTLRDRGHHPVLFAQGVAQRRPLVGVAAGHGLDVVVAGGPDTPHAEVRRRMQELADEHGSELIHAWEVRAARNGFFGPGRLGRIPVVTTFYGIRMLRGMPRHQPLVLGLGALMGDGRAFGHRDVRLVEPPVNTATDAPGQADGAAWRREHGIDEEELLLAIVTRLVPDLEKDAGAELTVAAVRALEDPRVRLAIVGAGPSLDRLRARAAEANAALGREAVLVPGQLADPRPAYAAADIVLGMGGSALRGLAFAKPVVVHGAAATPPSTNPARSSNRTPPAACTAGATAAATPARSPTSSAASSTTPAAAPNSAAGDGTGWSAASRWRASPPPSSSSTSKCWPPRRAPPAGSATSNRWPGTSSPSPPRSACSGGEPPGLPGTVSTRPVIPCDRTRRSGVVTALPQLAALRRRVVRGRSARRPLCPPSIQGI
ncbi:glycosyltransferase [Kitasatospora arboriphila]